MALYSWFLRAGATTVNQNASNKNSRTASPINGIENCTMWPTAKIKSNVSIAPVSHRSTRKNSTTLLATKKTLTMIKVK